MIPTCNTQIPLCAYLYAYRSGLHLQHDLCAIWMVNCQTRFVFVYRLRTKLRNPLQLYAHLSILYYCTSPALCPYFEINPFVSDQMGWQLPSIIANASNFKEFKHSSRLIRHGVLYKDWCSLLRTRTQWHCRKWIDNTSARSIISNVNQNIFLIVLEVDIRTKKSVYWTGIEEKNWNN